LPEDAETYQLGAAEASIEADVSAAASYTLRFPKQRGVLVLSPSRPDASSVEVSVETASAESSLGVVADIARDQFLHVDRFPAAAFRSSSLRRRPDGRYDLYGELELTGTKKSLVVQADLSVSACFVRVDSEFGIDRRVFGAVSDGGLDGVVSDTVVIRIHANVKRRSAPATCVAPDEG
jgi:polyisoprenoid-binding protein YceI